MTNIVVPTLIALVIFALIIGVFTLVSRYKAYRDVKKTTAPQILDKFKFENSHKFFVWFENLGEQVMAFTEKWRLLIWVVLFVITVLLSRLPNKTPFWIATAVLVLFIVPWESLSKISKKKQ